ATTIPPIINLEDSHKEAVIESSRKQYARLRPVVEKEIMDDFGTKQEPPKPKPATVRPVADKRDKNRPFVNSKVVNQNKEEVKKEDKQTLSLRDLGNKKKNNDNARKGKSANREELRSALASLLIGKETEARNIDRSVKNDFNDKKDKEFLTKTEVPEEVLRNILDVSSDKNEK